ncbi:MAG: fibronectin type III [Chlorobi bacterium]|nr:fibronectin type III [Chlorobiota bacterium]
MNNVFINLRRFIFLASSYVLLNISFPLSAQAILRADGPGNTYELINSILAPGHNAVESPDCAHPSFGRHIDEFYDSLYGDYVFRFHIHRDYDNDRCIRFDRQRVEIKTYDKSPDSLLGHYGERVIYKWEMKLDSSFVVSRKFTHLHQLKSVGSPDDNMPLITITARRKSNGLEFLEIRYAPHQTQHVIASETLQVFKDRWLSFYEEVFYDDSLLSYYKLVIRDKNDSSVLLYVESDTLRMWKDSAHFIRPKWGIYRSLQDSTFLKDEIVLFNNFFIKEINPILATNNYLLRKGSVEPRNLIIWWQPTKPAKHILKNYIVLSFDGRLLTDLYHFEPPVLLVPKRFLSANPQILEQ